MLWCAADPCAGSARHGWCRQENADECEDGVLAVHLPVGNEIGSDGLDVPRQGVFDRQHMRTRRSS